MNTQSQRPFDSGVISVDLSNSVTDFRSQPSLSSVSVHLETQGRPDATDRMPRVWSGLVE